MAKALWKHGAGEWITVKIGLSKGLKLVDGTRESHHVWRRAGGLAARSLFHFTLDDVHAIGYSTGVI